jgi:hypothetical protein
MAGGTVLLINVYTYQKHGHTMSQVPMGLSRRASFAYGMAASGSSRSSHDECDDDDLDDRPLRATIFQKRRSICCTALHTQERKKTSAWQNTAHQWLQCKTLRHQPITYVH